MKIGIISDTHGLLRREIVQAFKGCELIFHGGDIGKQAILDALQGIAPVVAVKGNNDKDYWAEQLPIESWTRVQSKMIYMIHNIKKKPADLEKNGIDIVISGHSHIYKEEIKEDILYLNPGGAGPKRFGRAATAMLLEIEDKAVRVEKIII